MKAMVGLIIAILIIFSLKLFWPSSQPDVGNVSLNKNKNEQDVISETSKIQDNSLSLDLKIPSDDEKIKLMTAEYEILKKARNKLRRRLARLKHDMWGLKFAPEKAKQMNEILLIAHKLIKNPDLLGAFSNVEGIRDEIAKVKFSEKTLDQVNNMIDENKDSSNKPD